MATTEAFTISNIDESEIGYVNINRAYKKGGLMIIDDNAFPKTAGVAGCTYFVDFFDEVICKWCKNLGIDNQTIVLKVNWDVDKSINTAIHKDKKDVEFFIDIEDGEIVKAYCDDYIINYNYVDDLLINDEYEVGIFGLIFDYYTGLISNNIKEYEDEETFEIWGVLYD